MDCPVNVAPEDEDCGSARRTYRACGRPAVVDVRDRYETFTACEKHAREAAVDGCTVDWPEGAAA